MPLPRIILLGGTSHCGKSTIATALAQKLGPDWNVQTTDRMGKHPGRPWRPDNSPVPPHVIAHFQNLPVEELLADVLRHYRVNILPQVHGLIAARLALPTGHTILEGSALWPAFLNPLPQEVTALWLLADEQLLRNRLLTESRHAEKPEAQRHLIEKFLARTLAYQQTLQRELVAHHLPTLHLTPSQTPAQIVETLQARLI